MSALSFNRISLNYRRHHGEPIDDRKTKSPAKRDGYLLPEWPLERCFAQKVAVTCSPHSICEVHLSDGYSIV
jgi:hypothetical protein